MHRLLVLPISVFLATGCLDEFEAAEGASPVAEIPVTESILEDTTWTKNNVYVLGDDALIYVEGDSVLTIEPGTQIRGNPGSALIITRDARIDAEGEPDEPIVFTSNQPVGQRKPGDWGGVVLLGNDELNKGGGVRQIEGISIEDEPRAQYGGSDQFDNCGSLDYVRIEFAGFELFDGKDGNDLNGLTLGGCGVNTRIRHVQVHRGFDDGIELFGGSVDLKWVVVTGALDDSIDWDEGWDGRIQFAVIHQFENLDPTVQNVGDEGFEGDGALGEDVDKDGLKDVQQPYTNPFIANVSIFGSGRKGTVHNGMDLREGTGATMTNMIIARQTGHGIDITDPQTAAWIDNVEPDQPSVSITYSIFHAVGPNGEQWAVPNESDINGEGEDAVDPGDGQVSDDGGFDELLDWLQRPDNEYNNTFGDPALPEPDLEGEWVRDPTPLWIPAAGSIANNGGQLPTENFFTTSAEYSGAIRPGSEVTWWDGWTAFPEN